MKAPGMQLRKAPPMGARTDWWRSGPRASGCAAALREGDGRAAPPPTLGAQLKLCSQVSRPGLWLVTVWVYLLPTGSAWHVWRERSFWIGLVHCTLPLNLLVYWWNDLGDFDTDATNPRKGGNWLGARAPAARLRALAPVVLVAQLPFALYYATHTRMGPLWTAAWFAAVCAVNFAYNCEPIKLSSKNPPFDFVGPLGYLLVVPLAERLNGTPPLPAVAWVHTLLLILRTQLWTELMDAPHDHAGGRVTTVLRLASAGGGLWAPRLLLLAILLAELAFVAVATHDVPLSLFSLLSVARCASEWRAEHVACRGRHKHGAGAAGGTRGEGDVAALVAADIVAGGSYQSGIEMRTTVVLGVSGIALLGYVWTSGVLSPFSNHTGGGGAGVV